MILTIIIIFKNINIRGIILLFSRQFSDLSNEKVIKSFYLIFFWNALLYLTLNNTVLLI